MRNKILFIIMAMIALVGVSHAQVPSPVQTGLKWSWYNVGDGLYQDAYNITVNNWTYVQQYPSANYIGQKTNYILLNLSISGDPYYMDAVGYTKAGLSVGSVPVCFVNGNPNTAMILASNYSISGVRWSMLTIFYNPWINGTTGEEQYLSSAPRVMCGWNIYNYSNVQIQMFDYTTDYSAIMKTQPQINSQYSTLPYARFNFTLCTINCIGVQTHGVPNSDPGFVVLANHTLNASSTSKFNITYFTPGTATIGNVVISAQPTSGHGYKLSSTASNNYLLTSFGTCVLGICSNTYQLSTSPGASSNANYIFTDVPDHPFDGTGFEAYFSSVANQIESEGLTANEEARCGLFGTGCQWGVMFNSTTTNNLGLDISGKAFQFGLNISTGSPTYFYILPAFSRNITANVVPPNNAQNGAMLNISSCFTGIGLCGFEYITHVPSAGVINWTYRFPTYAYPTKIGTKYNITFRAANVSYLKLYIPHYSTFGLACDDIYIVTNNTLGGAIPFTEIPFYVLNCNTSTATILLANHTLGGSYPYDSFYVLSGPKFYLSLLGSNTTVKNGWDIYTGNRTKIYYSGNTPYLISLNTSLDSYSRIILYNYTGTQDSEPVNISYGYMGYNGTDYVKECGSDGVDDRPACPIGNPIVAFNQSASDRTGYSNGYSSPILIANVMLGSTSTRPSLFTLNLGMFTNYTFPGYTLQMSVSNSTYYKQQSNENLYSYYGAYTNISLDNHVSANVTKLYASYICSITLGNCASKGTATAPGGAAAPGPPIVTPAGWEPNQTTKLNYSNSTTIGYNGLSSSPNLVLGGATGVSIPEYLLYIFAIIFVIFGAVTLGESKESMYGIVFILIAVWFLGLTNYFILAIAAILSVVFAIYELTSNRPVQKVKQVHHHG